jgi:FkbM family methyltransferase
LNNSYHNWLNSMNWQLDFYRKSLRKRRIDDEFDWVWLNSSLGWKGNMKSFIKPFVYFVCRRTIPYSQPWFNEKSELLWNSRQMLEDDLSRHLFDCHLLLTIAGYRKYYYPRTDYDDFISIQSEADLNNDLPKDYLGYPLKIYRIILNGSQEISDIKIIATKSHIELLNRYRQYFIKRGNVDFSPSKGEVVFDCGACIGEIALIFAALVGASGQIHLFDPVPLHIRYCHLHAALNPSLSHAFRINSLAVSDSSRVVSGEKNDSKVISPGGCVVDNFETISLDDYVLKSKIDRVDYIKMDIEGSEILALQGAQMVIRDFKPKLAISTYHRPEDLWEIPILISKLNNRYKMYFGHHSPMSWESVYYVV